MCDDPLFPGRRRHQTVGFINGPSTELMSKSSSKLEIRAIENKVCKQTNLNIALIHFCEDRNSASELKTVFSNGGPT